MVLCLLLQAKKPPKNKDKYDKVKRAEMKAAKKVGAGRGRTDQGTGGGGREARGRVVDVGGADGKRC